MFDLTGKTALVTGASGGIGGAIAQALHAAGATVALSGTRTAPLEALAADLGSRAHVLTCDLSDPASVEALPKSAAAAMVVVSVVAASISTKFLRFFGFITEKPKSEHLKK
jgi:3-oxoacyl-[acyl-carrier protein] reductase